MATQGKVVQRLSPREVHIAAVGVHQDGAGLMLTVTMAGANWLYRFTSPTGRRRDMGLGPCVRDSLRAAGKSLTDARGAADDARHLLRDGKDPIAERDARREAARAAEAASKAQTKREQMTLARAARGYHERVIEPNRTPVHAREWIGSLERHTPVAIWHKPVDEVTGPELLDWLIDLQDAIPETCSRVRQRLEAIFDDCEFRELRSGNPARAIRRKLAEAAKRRERGHLSALDYRKVPAFMTDLRGRPGISARALEFAILTAARTAEVTGAAWDEFSLDAGVWTVPAARMKAHEVHVVHLSARALEILREMKELEQRYVFPAPRGEDKPLSNMAMLTLLRRMDADRETTVHGIARSSFSTWANETGAGRPDVIEACLAHREGDRIRSAYNRAQFAAERRALLASWADYCAGIVPAASATFDPRSINATWRAGWVDAAGNVHALPTVFPFSAKTAAWQAARDAAERNGSDAFTVLREDATDRPAWAAKVIPFPDQSREVA